MVMRLMRSFRFCWHKHSFSRARASYSISPACLPAGICPFHGHRRHTWSDWSYIRLVNSAYLRHWRLVLNWIARTEQRAHTECTLVCVCALHFSMWWLARQNDRSCTYDDSVLFYVYFDFFFGFRFFVVVLHRFALAHFTFSFSRNQKPKTF